MFYDDYLSLADDETTFGAKSDNYLKVCIHAVRLIRVTSLDSSQDYMQLNIQNVICRN